MRYYITICILLFLSALNLKAEKHALIIAIGDYPTDGGWPDISSHNDIPHVEGALIKLGFQKKNMMMLQDKEATKSAILSAFANIESKLKKGDILFIHFSGHGQQVVDDNGDEIDNLDEAIVPYNSPIKWLEGFNEGQYLIRDDIIGKWTNKYREILGDKGQVVVILDSCHSGSGTRGLGLARGTDQIMAPSNINNLSASQTTQESTMGIYAGDDKQLAPMASYFGASSRELNYETTDDQDKPVGSLSFAFYSIVSKMTNPMSFDELFDRLSLKMKSIAPRQNPQWEGPADVYFLGGEASRKDYLFSINSFVNEQKIVVDIGTMGDVFEGTQIQLIDVNDQKVLSNGVITKALLNRSEVRLDVAVNEDADRLYKIKIAERTLPPILCSMSSQINEESPWSQVSKSILEQPFIQWQEANPELYLIEDVDLVLSLMTRDGVTLFEKPFIDGKEARTLGQLESAIKSYTQGKYLRSFESDASSYLLTTEIIEVDCNDESNQLQSFNSQSSIQIEIGTCIKLKISNEGTKPAYFSMLDIQPDNVVNVIIPAVELGYTADEYYLKPGETFITDYSIEIGEPFGDEVLKLIGSNEPLDLSGIIRSRGASTRGPSSDHPFEALMAATFQEESTRGAKIRKPSIEEVGTETVYFQIIGQ